MTEPKSAFLSNAARLPPPPTAASGGAYGGAAESKAGDTGAPVTAGAIDVVICYDGTLSMKPYCDGVRDAVRKVTEFVSTKAASLGADVQWAAVGYTDFPKSAVVKDGEIAAKIAANFGGPDGVNAAVEAHEYQNGHDFCEDPLSGFCAIRRLKGWRPDSGRAVVLVLDAPPHGVDKLLPSLQQEFKGSYDNFPDGSPTGSEVMDGVTDLVSNCRIDYVFVVWCVEERPDIGARWKATHLKMSECAMKFVHPQPTEPLPAGTTPRGFFYLRSNNIEEVSTSLGAMVVELCLASIVKRSANRETATRSVTASIAKSAAGSLPVPATNSRVGTINATSTAEIGELVGTYLQTSTASSAMSTRAKELGLLPPSSVELDYDAKEEPITIPSISMGNLYQGKLTTHHDGKPQEELVSIKALQVEFQDSQQGSVPCPDDLRELKSLISLGSGKTGLVRFRGWTRPSAFLRSKLGTLKPNHKWVLLVMKRYTKSLQAALDANELSDAELIRVIEDLVGGLMFVHKEDRAIGVLNATAILLTEESRPVMADLSRVVKIDFGRAPVPGAAPGVRDPDAFPNDIRQFGVLIEQIIARMASPPPFLRTFAGSCKSATSAAPTSRELYQQFVGAKRSFPTPTDRTSRKL